MKENILLGELEGRGKQKLVKQQEKLVKLKEELADKNVTGNTLFEELEGSVFLKSYTFGKEDYMTTYCQRIGVLSLHFDSVVGPYVSFEKYSLKKFDDGSLIPSRFLFSKYSFGEANR